ncbi:MAG: alpha-galactosidase [Saprospiraceae bacterium]|nr:alpha-galactosidase [Saprospiraceae bacterium]
MHFRQAVLKLNDKTYTLLPGRANSFDEIYADFQQTAENGGARWGLFLHPKQDVVIQRLEIQFDWPLSAHARFFANGYQSGSESRWLSVGEANPRTHWLARIRAGKESDEHIPDIPRGRGYWHSWTYTSVCHAAEAEAKNGGHAAITFFGSLNENTGFTLFLYDQPNGIFTVRKDMDGLQLSHSFPALDFWIGEGSEREVFERYFALLGIEPTPNPAQLGWGSDGIGAKKIAEKDVFQSLDNVAGSALPFRIFQIGEGWQTDVGDWLSSNERFPNGMGLVAQKIKEKGMVPCLWLAPFAVSKNSSLSKKHPNWLLKNAKGAPLKIGWSRKYGGGYHALDFYNNEVRNHLGGVFHQVLEQWGFEVIRLDYLFAACAAPPSGKTRGQVMHEAMEFLKKLAGSKKSIACGVPLGAVFGLVDYCRLGGEAHQGWKNRLQALLGLRNRADTQTSLRSSLGHWPLVGRAFHNVLDVFSLEAGQSKRVMELQYTSLTIHALLGSLLFSGDKIERFAPEQIAELEAVLDWRGSRATQVIEAQKDVFQIYFENGGAHFCAYCNLTSKPQTLTRDAERIELMPFETLVLTQVNNKKGAHFPN